ncbi:hypothetical protein RSAG8_04909, partial [Rhizoctonia solani AG-8 WAC10335]
MLPRLRIRQLAALAIQNELFHTSACIAAHGPSRRSQRFVPARARLSELPKKTTAEPPDFVPLKHISKEIEESAFKKTRERERQRQLIIPLPDSKPQDIPHSASSRPHFSSPPLLPGLGWRTLSLTHFFRDGDVSGHSNGTLLAAETGSGKSLAYLLPLVQALKSSELSSTDSSNLASPRALILVPTHELARQVKSTLSHLTHAPDTKLRSVTFLPPTEGGEFQVSPPEQTRHNPDVVVGTPARILDLTRPGGRHSVGPMRPAYEDTVKREFERDVKMDYGRVEWVVVDEADVLFDPDFALWTEAILSDIPKPYNLVLTTATISAHLSKYLSTYHPTLTRLTTPELHRLPASLQTEYVEWDRRPGNRDPMVLRKLKDTWAEEARQHPGWKERTTPSARYLSSMSRETRLILFIEPGELVVLEGQGGLWYLLMEGTRVRSLGRGFRVARGSPGVPEKYLHLTQRSLLVRLSVYFGHGAFAGLSAHSSVVDLSSRISHTIVRQMGF